MSALAESKGVDRMFRGSLWTALATHGHCDVTASGRHCPETYAGAVPRNWSQWLELDVDSELAELDDRGAPPPGRVG
jgi:hypothetical protein